MTRLLHCPFCAEEEKVRPFCEESGGGGTFWKRWKVWIVCDACGAHGPLVESAMSKAIALDTAHASWNNRIPHDEDLALRIAFTMT